MASTRCWTDAVGCTTRSWSDIGRLPRRLSGLVQSSIAPAFRGGQGLLDPWLLRRLLRLKIRRKIAFVDVLAPVELAVDDADEIHRADEIVERFVLEIAEAPVRHAADGAAI